MDYRCTMANKLKCKARGTISNTVNESPIARLRGEHNHLPQIKELPKSSNIYEKATISDTIKSKKRPRLT